MNVYEPEIVTVPGKGYQLVFNAATELGELRAGAITVPLVEFQVKQLRDSLPTDRDQLAAGIVQNHQLALAEKMRKMRR